MTRPLLKKTKKILIDPRFGKRPEDRDIDELLDSGMVIIDKPMGPTSHQVSSWVREMLGIEKTAHGGTLDPRVTGVLPIGLGASARAIDYLHEAGKRYVGVMKLHNDIDDQSLKKVVEEFTGEIFQIPPVRAAVKRMLRTRTIYSLEILERTGRDVLIDVRCEGGTYIRSLCVDIGEALAVGAHLQDLRRIEAGGFRESATTTLHGLRDAAEYWRDGNSDELRKLIRPMEDIFVSWKQIIVKDSAVDALCHGANLAIPGIVELSKDIISGDRVAIFTIKGEILATGITEMDAKEILSKKDGVATNLERVFMKPGTYPRIWSSKSST